MKTSWIGMGLALCLMASCQTQDALPDGGLVGYDPHLIENQEAACIDRGGRFGPGGLSDTFVCYEETRDGNRSCDSASDCEGVCLARSRSCSPIKPLFGCNEVLTVSGASSTLCIK